MEKYCLEIAGLKRELPFVKINDELAYASFVVISDKQLIETAAPLLAEKIRDCDIIVTGSLVWTALWSPGNR